MAAPKKYSDSEPEEGEVDGSDNEVQLYCICRRPDTNRFMIGCESCDEWYHGDCINITEEYANKIKHYFCLPCREKNPKLELVFKERKKPAKRKHESVGDENRKAEDSDFEDEAKKDDKFIASDDDDSDFGESRRRKPKKVVSGKPPPAKAPKRETKSKTQTSRHRTKESKRIPSDDRRGRRNRDSLEDREGPRHCYGPGCIESARRGSKYCSDACGMKLAQNRIYEILPNRIHQWQRLPSIADENDLKSLEKIKQEQDDARKRLNHLDEKQQKLDELIIAAKKAELLTEEEMEEYEEQLETEADLNTYCVTCGHEVSNKMIVRHMERCFNKHEAQSSLGAFFKTKIDDLFCDVFNPQSKTYCKRLRILCPEHTKEGKISEDEVCGFPLVSEVFQETGQYCRLSKKKCTKHHGWEKIRRALIDMERVQQWLKIDELFEREQRIRWIMSQRGGVVGLMLNQTIAEESDNSSRSSSSPGRENIDVQE